MFRRRLQSTRCLVVPLSHGIRRASTEEQQELEREAQLRDRIRQKQTQGESFFGSVMRRAQEQQQQQQQNSGSGAAGQQANWGNGVSPHVMNLYTFAMYLTAFYMVALVLQLRQEQSAANLVQGAPWWAVAPDNLAAYLLTKILKSRWTQRQLQQDFEAFAKTAPGVSFAQFVLMRQPDAFNGYHTTQADLIAGIARCVSSSSDFSLARKLLHAARSQSDEKAKVDEMMATLRRDYPHVMTAAPVSPFTAAPLVSANGNASPVVFGGGRPY